MRYLCGIFPTIVSSLPETVWERGLGVKIDHAAIVDILLAQIDLDRTLLFRVYTIIIITISHRCRNSAIHCP